MSIALPVVKAFVIWACQNRPSTHGYGHMEKVANWAGQIATGEGLSLDLQFYVILIAWLHDVADHKYDKDGQLALEVTKFLRGYYNPNLVDQLLTVIKYISYSKEYQLRNKNHNSRIDWQLILGGDGLITIRNIASDADKLEAIGAKGIYRAMECTIEYHPTEKLSADQIIEKTIQHYHDKLKHLVPEYFMTIKGKELAGPLVKEMETEIEKLSQLRSQVTAENESKIREDLLSTIAFWNKK